MAEYVTVRHPATLEERQVAEGAVRFFTNQGYKVLDAAGRVKAKQPTPATSSDKKEN